MTGKKVRKRGKKTRKLQIKIKQRKGKSKRTRKSKTKRNRKGRKMKGGGIKDNLFNLFGLVTNPKKLLLKIKC